MNIDLSMGYKGYLRGKIELFGVDHQVLGIPTFHNTELDIQDFVDPLEYMKGVDELNDGKLVPVAVPGFVGEFILVIYPYDD